MPPSHLSPSAAAPTGRHLSFAEREHLALARARGDGVREIARQLGRAPSTISRELRRNAATRSGGFEYRAATAQWHADRSARRPKPAKLQTNPTLQKYVQDKACRQHCDARRKSDCGTSGVVEGSSSWAQTVAPMGSSMESGANRATTTDRLPGRHFHAHQPRGDIPGSVRAGTWSVASRADCLFAHGACTARAERARPRPREVLCDTGDPDQRETGLRGGSCSARSLGRRSDSRDGQLGDRNAGRANDEVHNPAAPSPASWSSSTGAREEWPGSGRSRRAGGA